MSCIFGKCHCFLSTCCVFDKCHVCLINVTSYRLMSRLFGEWHVFSIVFATHIPPTLSFSITGFGPAGSKALPRSLLGPLFRLPTFRRQNVSNMSDPRTRSRIGEIMLGNVFTKAKIEESIKVIHSTLAI